MNFYFMEKIKMILRTKKVSDLFKQNSTKKNNKQLAKLNQENLTNSTILKLEKRKDKFDSEKKKENKESDLLAITTIIQKHNQTNEIINNRLKSQLGQQRFEFEKK